MAIPSPIVSSTLAWVSRKSQIRLTEPLPISTSCFESKGLPVLNCKTGSPEGYACIFLFARYYSSISQLLLLSSGQSWSTHLHKATLTLAPCRYRQATAGHCYCKRYEVNYELWTISTRYIGLIFIHYTVSGRRVYNLNEWRLIVVVCAVKRFYRRLLRSLYSPLAPPSVTQIPPRKGHF